MAIATTYTITIGLESPRLTPEECRAFALIAAGRHFPSGHTITEATGRWESPERGLVDEPSLVITVIGEGQSHRDAVLRFATDYKKGCFQDCVLVQISRPDTLWI